MFQKRWFLTALTTLVIVAALLLPMSASAARWETAVGKMMVPPDATQTYTLEVSGIKVVVPPGAYPKGGPVVLQVQRNSDGQFVASFHPELTFDAPVMMDFGTCSQVIYDSRSGPIVIVTSDLDGDGVVGEIESLHFSRYSGW